MPITSGEDFALKVETAPNNFVTVNDMHAYSKTSRTDAAQFKVFQKTVPYTLQDTNRQHTFTVSGYLSIGDAGQQALINAELNRTTVKIQVLPDGTNGFAQTVRVQSKKHDANAENAPQALDFEFTGVDEPTIVGTGPIL